MSKPKPFINQLIVEAMPEFIAALKAQLEEDYIRWGDEWKNRPLDGQEARTWQRLNTYWRDFDQGHIPIPWLKVAGCALICWWRERKGHDLR